MRPTWNEQDRLAALRGYGVLDSDEDFSDFVRIAAKICDAPIAVVNFIDQTRQWFGAEIGLGVRETPLDISICSRAILQNEMLVVPDLMADAQFGGNSLVAGDPGLRFYGGALLKTEQGLPLGTVCVLDYAPRPLGLTEDQTFTLQALARQVMTQLNLRVQLAQKELLRKEAHHRVSNSLHRVQALLRMQAERAVSDESATLLTVAARRVQFFADMHRHLYNDSTDPEIGLSAYLKSLIESENEMAAGSEGRSVTLVGDDVRWPALDAPNLGLVTLELVTNALKYGEGAVTVTVTDQDGSIDITVEDEGRDLPPTLESARGTGLGMLIVNGLLDANDGRLIVDRSRGHTCFIARINRAGAPAASGRGGAAS